MYEILPMDNDRIWNLIAKKLSGEASAVDLKELESTLRLDPDLHYSLEAMQDMWNKQSVGESEESDAAFHRHMGRMHDVGVDMGSSDAEMMVEVFASPARHFMNWKTLTFALSAILILTLVFHFASPRNQAPIIQKNSWEVITRNGSKTNLLLPDGTMVWLNAGSRLSYDSLYGTKIREVTLSGEAYFDVVKNANKPFIIHTGKINIRVLGTVFNVKSYPGEKTIETSLIKGSIEVSFPAQPSRKIVLKPNQKLVLDSMDMNTAAIPDAVVAKPVPPVNIQHLNRIGSDSVIAETSWMQNRLYFSDMSLQELLKSMERKYGVTFQLTSGLLDTVHFTGSFQNETVTQALDALRLTAEKSTMDFKYEVKGNQITIYNNTNGVH